MKFTNLSQGGGYNLPPCHMLNLSGFHILFDCPLDLSALTLFSPVSTSLYEDTFSNKSSKNLLDRTNLIPVEPYYKTVERLHLWNVSLIDVVLISSPMGMLGLPFLTRTKGFSAKIYATEATTRLSEFMMKDLVAMNMEFKQLYGPQEDNNSFLQFFNWENLEALPPSLKQIVLGKDGAQLASWMPVYSAGDVKECLQKVETLVYSQEACYNGSMIIKAFSSGLEIGACNWSLKTPKRNISYISSSIFTSEVAMDFDFHALIGSDVLIYSDFANSENASNQESNDGDDDSSLLNSDERSEEMEKLNFICLCSIDSLKSGGSVLIPTGRLSIVLQLLELFALHIDSSDLKVPIFIISSVAEELLAYTCIIPEWLCNHRQEKMYSGKPVFGYEEVMKEKKIHIFPTLDSRELLMMWQEPCIVICPHWSLRLGPVVHLLQRWHGDPNSLLVLEEGVDTDVALSPFKPISMKVLECSFISGIKLEKVPQLLKRLQPKQILVPDYTKPFMEALSNSLPCLFYTEAETLHLPKSKNLCELQIPKNLALTSKIKELTMSRLKGELYVDGGKHYLVEGKKAPQGGLDEIGGLGLVHYWGKVDLESLLVGLDKVGVKGSVMECCGSSSNVVVNVVEPEKGLIELKETSVVVSIGDESLASVISDIIHGLLNSI